MAYDLHIQRTEQQPIALSEWRAAVDATEGVRLFTAAAHTITNRLGEVIRVGARDGDAEVFFPDAGEWHPVFRWRGTSAVFSARFDPTEISHPVWRAAVALATRLRASIRGDDGETYDLPVIQ